MSRSCALAMARVVMRPTRKLCGGDAGERVALVAGLPDPLLHD